jgi:hypothetical protein
MEPGGVNSSPQLSGLLRRGRGMWDDKCWLFSSSPPCSALVLPWAMASGTGFPAAGTGTGTAIGMLTYPRVSCRPLIRRNISSWILIAFSSPRTTISPAVASGGMADKLSSRQTRRTTSMSPCAIYSPSSTGAHLRPLAALSVEAKAPIAICPNRAGLRTHVMSRVGWRERYRKRPRFRDGGSADPSPHGPPRIVSLWHSTGRAEPADQGLLLSDTENAVRCR